MTSNYESLDDDLGMFEASVSKEVIELESPKIKRMVAVLDGTNQNTVTSTLAKQLAEQLGVKVVEEQAKETSAERIHKIMQSQNADLLIMPVPFGRDIDVLKDESLGSVADMLLQESKCPVLCVRQPMDEEEIRQALSDVLIPVLDLEKGHEKAVSWALAMARKDCKIELLGVADEEVIAEAKQMLGDSVDPEVFKAEALNRAVTRDIGGLVAAIQKRASEENFKVRVEVKAGHPIELALKEANARPRLTVVFTPHEHTSLTHHHAVDLVLGANGPVMVV